MQGSPGADGMAEEPIASAVPFTCRITAAFRAVELARGAPPIIEDPLAPHLAGVKALEIAEQDYEKLVAVQGPGLHMRIPARNRLLDDKLLAALMQMRAGGMQGPLQVVNLGAGMDTRPWRLAFPAHVSYFDVDQPDVMRLKQALLAKAGAQTSVSASSCQSTDCRTNSSGTASSGGKGSAFPITAASWKGIGVDLSQLSLREALAESSFVEGAPTVWVAEALLYYLTLPQASELLRAMASLSGAGSTLLATCIDRELLDASLHRMQGHYFSQLWHFCMDDLWEPSSKDSGVGGSSSMLQGAAGALGDCGWEVVGVPRTTAQLALAEYNMATYVPSYGGAECFFSARLRQ